MKSDKLIVSELFYSLQGEGLHMGTPSVFLRLFGCNLQCQGFGMPRGQLSEERLKIDPNKVHITSINPNNYNSVAPNGYSTETTPAYQKYSDLPLVSTGCDSYASWDTRFKHLSKEMSNDQIENAIRVLLPKGVFTNNIHLVITGGEPLLPMWQKLLPALIDQLGSSLHLTNVTFETNGTQKLSDQFINDLHGLVNLTFSISPKLTCSGESWKKTIKPAIVTQYADLFFTESSNGFFKFVVADQQDVEDVIKALQQYDADCTGLSDYWPVYLMPVGGTDAGYNLTKKQVAELALANGWRYSPRLQIDLWKNSWGT